MTDIVERLRDAQECVEHSDWDNVIDRMEGDLAAEAADEIERLRERGDWLEHMNDNLHSHIKRLEDINLGLERENAKLMEAALAFVP